MQVHSRILQKPKDTNALEVVSVSKASSKYPVALQKYFGDMAPNTIWALGNLDILQHKAIALFCSVKCPGNLILKTYDLARSLRDKGIVVISGFHSPMERECLDLLLRGKQPVIICQAMRLASKRFPEKYATPLSQGRLLMISPFSDTVRRAQTSTAAIRNEIVSALADKVFVSYAAPRSKTETLCRKIIEWGKPLLTFDSKENNSLITAVQSHVTLIDTNESNTLFFDFLNKGEMIRL